MKILLIGKNGQLGSELNQVLLPMGELVSVDYPEFDFLHLKSLINEIQLIKPDLIINAGAYTDVDKAEREPDLARIINAIAPGEIAKIAAEVGAGFIHYSTDYVFDGTKGSPYIESDIPNPINTYGVTKLEGENLVQTYGSAYLILRTSWLYSLRKGGFVEKVLSWARTQEVMHVVDDQFGSPTWARTLAYLTAQVITQCQDDVSGYLTEKSGIYHLAGAGSVSRFEFAKAILELDQNKHEQTVKQLLPAKTAEFLGHAVRPLFSALASTKLADLNLTIEGWHDSLRWCMTRT